MVTRDEGGKLEDRTERVCGVFGLAMHHMFSSEKVEGDENSTFPMVRARMVNH